MVDCTLELALHQGCSELGLELNAAQRQCLLEYLGLMQKWNRVYNLTAVRDPAQMLTHHLLDCLAVLPAVQRWVAMQRKEAGLRVLDVGSGAGLPGVILAIGDPVLLVDCVDAVAKKTAFIQQAASALCLPHVRALHARVEALAERYDLIVSRAFSSLLEFCACSDGLLAEQGVWLAMKGKYPDAEISALPRSIDVFHVEHLRVPGLSAERCLVWMRKR